MKNVRQLAKIGFLVVMGIIPILPVLYFGWLVTYLSFPEWVGPHQEFYRTCKSISAGSTLEQARAKMKRYAEVGRTWSAPANLPAGIFGATVPGVRETRNEAETRILFIPDGRNVADWCLVYPSKGRVARVEVSPD